jgi:hypothetical protein
MAARSLDNHWDEPLQASSRDHYFLLLSYSVSRALPHVRPFMGSAEPIRSPSDSRDFLQVRIFYRTASEEVRVWMLSKDGKKSD